MPKIAALDLGTNSFHLIVAESEGNSGLKLIDREKEVIRLGEGNKGDLKLISPESMSRAIEAIQRFKAIAESHNAFLRAVATSAVRESVNNLEFIEKVYAETGVEIEVVSGIEEARLIYLGILRAVPVYNQRVLTIDIGGGSTEFVIGEEGRIIFSTSLKLGAVRMTQMFFPEAIVTDEAEAKCRKWIAGEIVSVRRAADLYGFEKCVGSSGSILAAGMMSLANENKSIDGALAINNKKFSKSQIGKVTEETLKLTTPEERLKIPGLETKRADIIPAGLLIIDTIMEELGIKEIVTSEFALREGIVIDTLSKIDPDSRDEKLRDLRLSSVKQLAERCRYDKKHCEHVGMIATSIFDQTRKLHGLGKNARELLYYAALLHDVGHHIGHSKHHRHSEYIIRNSELMGFSQDEINIIATVSRYHRKSHPKKSHAEYNSFPERLRSKVRKLAAILRVADALDRTHQGAVQFVEVQVSSSEVVFKIKPGKVEPDMELWNFERRKGLFEEVFGIQARAEAG